jgi:2-aminoadipate transaminase
MSAGRSDLHSLWIQDDAPGVGALAKPRAGDAAEARFDRVQPSLTPSWGSIEYAQTRIVSLLISRQFSKMTLPIPLSSAAQRTHPSSISHLMQTALENPGLVSLAAGFVDQQSLPVEIMARAAANLLGEPVEGRRSLQYGTTIGDLRLRARLLEYLERSECRPEGFYKEAISRTIVTTGSAQLIYLVCEAILNPGDIVLVESPTYFVFLGPVETRGARAIRIPIDDDGLRLDRLEAMLGRLESEGQLERVKMIYTIPEHANPTGISLAAERRQPLVDLAKRWSKTHRIFVLEDAAYRGLSFGSAEPPSLWSLDREAETVILARTFSKTLSPGLKTGFGVLPHGLVEPILTLKTNHDFGSANFNQRLLEQILSDGSYDRHVARLTALYRRKCGVFLTALAEHVGALDSEVQWTRPQGGLFVWMTVPEGLDTSFAGPLFRQCVHEGVIYVPGDHAFAPEPEPAPKNHMRLSFGVPGESELIEGARRLGAALCACLNPVG